MPQRIEIFFRDGTNKTFEDRYRKYIVEVDNGVLSIAKKYDNSYVKQTYSTNYPLDTIKHWQVDDD